MPSVAGKLTFTKVCIVMITLENGFVLPIQVKIHVFYDPEIIVLDIYPTLTWTYMHQGTYTRMFIAALFQ